MDEACQDMNRDESITAKEDRMKLYARKMVDVRGEVTGAVSREERYLSATPAELRVAARPHADLEAAKQAIIKHLGPMNPDVLHVAWESAAHQIVDAALGADNE